MGIATVSAVERVAGGDDEGLDQVAGLLGGVRRSCLNGKWGDVTTYEPNDDEMTWSDVSLCGPHISKC